MAVRWPDHVARNNYIEQVAALSHQLYEKLLLDCYSKYWNIVYGGDEGLHMEVVRRRDQLTREARRA